MLSLRADPNLNLTRLPMLKLHNFPLLLLSLLTAGAAFAQTSVPPAPTDAQRPVVVSGTVPDEATRQAILAKVRAVYGDNRVVDQLGVDAVSAPPNWTDYVQHVITDDLKQVKNGELDISGNTLSIRGDVSDDSARQQLPTTMSSRLNPTYQIINGLHVATNEQQLLDRTLANRTVEFESGSATLTAKGNQLLDEMLTAIKKLNNRQILIIGHTDNQGNPKTNQNLSQARADTVKQYFTQHGIDGKTLQTQGKGSQEPIATNDTPDGRARNRRIEFRTAN